MGFFRKDSDGNISSYPAKAGLYLLYIPGLGDNQ